MKASELRIGNYVKHNERVVMIDAFNSSSAWIEYLKHEEDMSSFSEVDLERLFPVQLTEQLLLGFGFSFHKGDGSFELFEVAIKQTDKEMFIPAYKYTDAGWQYLNQCGIMYVHQLQNLYFALTGIELTLNK